MDYGADKVLKNMERSECFRMNSMDHIGIEVADVGNEAVAKEDDGSGVGALAVSSST